MGLRIMAHVHVYNSRNGTAVQIRHTEVKIESTQSSKLMTI